MNTQYKPEQNDENEKHYKQLTTGSHDTRSQGASDRLHPPTARPQRACPLERMVNQLQPQPVSIPIRDTNSGKPGVGAGIWNTAPSTVSDPGFPPAVVM